jgi:hypothetical protein
MFEKTQDPGKIFSFKLGCALKIEEDALATVE